MLIAEQVVNANKKDVFPERVSAAPQVCSITQPQNLISLTPDRYQPSTTHIG